MGSIATVDGHPGALRAGRILEWARAAQTRWSARSVAARLPVVREFRHLLADRASELAQTVRRAESETLSAEVLPLAAACRFLEREAPGLLRSRSHGARGRPLWLSGVSLEIHREPLGVVLIVAPSNYPLFLPGVQMIQAIVAGNAVVVKPGRGAGAAAAALRDLAQRAGAPEGLVTVTDESTATVIDIIQAGVDKVLLTGSSETGRTVLESLVPEITPAVLELSGCDAVFVREDANLDLVAAALRFGLTLNDGATCIGPRRVFVHRSRADDLERKLAAALADAEIVTLEEPVFTRLRGMILEALQEGARMSVGREPVGTQVGPIVLADVGPEMSIAREDVFAPVLSLIPVENDAEALELASRCDFELGATVFGNAKDASALARQVRAGTVVVNDMIVPTADPRVPFGGRHASGYGVTRGAEGLLELTRLKTIIRRRGRFRPHFEPVGPREERLISSFVQLGHARSIGRRVRAVADIIRALAGRGRPDSPQE